MEGVKGEGVKGEGEDGDEGAVAGGGSVGTVAVGQTFYYDVNTRSGQTYLFQMSR